MILRGPARQNLPTVKSPLHKQGNHGTSSILDTAKFVILSSIFHPMKSPTIAFFKARDFVSSGDNAPLALKGV
jgi:hypothetical protein